MIVLYQAGGAGDFHPVERSSSGEESREILANAARLLESRGLHEAADLLQSIPFEVWKAVNTFNNEFAVLLAKVAAARYGELRLLGAKPGGRDRFAQIARALDEVGPYIRFIAVEEGEEPPPPKANEAAERSLADAAERLRNDGSTEGTERILPALKGYFLDLCARAGIPADPEGSLVEIGKCLREQHPAFQGAGSRAKEIGRILRMLTSALEGLALPGGRSRRAALRDSPPEKPEAALLISIARALLQYLEEKTQSAKPI